MAVDGELPVDEAKKVQEHLTGCWTCRTRMQEIENTIADFIHLREAAVPQLPPADGPRALLKLRLAQLAESSRPTLWQRITPTGLQKHVWGPALGISVAVLIGIFGVRVIHPDRHLPREVEIRSVPDPRLTPGATLPLTRNDVCGGDVVETAHVVPVSVAKKVFAAYGVDKPEPRAYEVDYLITPALGGSDNIRNFWPQPYRNTLWNAHIKDALEDHLRELVCRGEVDLTTAQHEIAADWIGAYKKYFHTQVPLPEHNSFLKDHPWE